MVAVKVLEPPLDKLSADARAYPVHLLREGEQGLCLFAAGFLGINDVVHMARMDMLVTCVDTDAARLQQMSGYYPPGRFKFVVDDAWEWSEAAQRIDFTYDVVSVDTWTGDLMYRSLASLELWCSLARRVVTATITPDADYTTPAGWEASTYERSDLASWLVLTRA